MNAMTKAHALTKATIKAGDNYAATFALCLKHIHNEAKPMNEAQKLMAVYIAQAEARIAELKAFEATNPTGFVVVSLATNGTLKFEDNTVSVSKIENASRYPEIRIADAKGRQVRNGAGYKSVGRHIRDQIEFEIADQLANIETMKKV